MTSKEKCDHCNRERQFNGHHFIQIPRPTRKPALYCGECLRLIAKYTPHRSPRTRPNQNSPAQFSRVGRIHFKRAEDTEFGYDYQIDI